MDNATMRRVEQWREAGLIDAATAERIRAWEEQHAPAHSTRLGRIAFGFGGLLLGAGILLFVAANWDLLSPWERLGLLAAIVAALHLGGGLVRSRSAALSTTLHAVGTAALGAGIFLAGQAFNLAENWPTGFLLWSLGAACALWAFRDWPHALWVALLVPMWLVTEWQAQPGFSAGGLLGVVGPYALPAFGLLVLNVAYLAAVGRECDATWRRALSRLGAIVLVPVGAMLPFADPGGIGLEREWPAEMPVLPVELLTLGWAVTIAVPLLVGWCLRGSQAWPLLAATAFAIAVGLLEPSTASQRVLMHLLYVAACAGLVWWGVRDAHRLRINVGVLGFALTVLSFYYSSVFDRFGRALGLIGLGALFIGGGWWLERARRQLLGRVDGGHR